MSRASSRHIVFDATPEIFATDNTGSFHFPLLVHGEGMIPTEGFDEVRLTLSLWHPSGKRNIDLDKAYVELRACFDAEADHWTKLAEIEPVVPPYGAGDSFDGWIVLPVLAARTAFALYGSGLEARSRLQLRASAYLVS